MDLPIKNTVCYNYFITKDTFLFPLYKGVSQEDTVKPGSEFDELIKDTEVELKEYYAKRKVLTQGGDTENLWIDAQAERFGINLLDTLSENIAGLEAGLTALKKRQKEEIENSKK